MADYEFITKNNETCLLMGDAKTINLKEAVGIVAMTTFANMVELKEIKNEEEKNRLKEKINFQSKVLDSLSNALNAIK